MGPLADRAACRRLSAAASDVPTCVVTARWAAMRADCSRRMVSIPSYRAIGHCLDPLRHKLSCHSCATLFQMTLFLFLRLEPGAVQLVVEGKTSTGRVGQMAPDARPTGNAPRSGRHARLT